MAVSVSASTVGVGAPPVVQVVIDGLTVGDVVTVAGRAAESSWDVRGPSWTAASSQLVVLDEVAGINVPVTYEVRVGGVLVATSAAVTVPFAGDFLLQSADGSVTLVPLVWRSNGLPRKVAVDQHFTSVAGRARPVLRFAPSGGASGTWQVRTDRAGSRVLEQLLAAGAPVLLRTDGNRRDLEAVHVVALSDDDSELWAAIEDGKPSDGRVWSLTWVELDDPLAGVPASGDTWLDVDNAYGGSTFADLDAAYSGSTFGDWNRTDWEGLGA